MIPAKQTLPRRRSAEHVAHLRAALDSGRLPVRQEDRAAAQVARAERMQALADQQK